MQLGGPVAQTIGRSCTHGLRKPDTGRDGPIASASARALQGSRQSEHNVPTLMPTRILSSVLAAARHTITLLATAGLSWARRWLNTRALALGFSMVAAMATGRGGGVRKLRVTESAGAGRSFRAAIGRQEGRWGGRVQSGVRADRCPDITRCRKSTLGSETSTFSV
jgi:hypothetical protein